MYSTTATSLEPSSFNTSIPATTTMGLYHEQRDLGIKQKLGKMKKLPGKLTYMAKQKVGLVNDLKHILKCLKSMKEAEGDDRKEMISDMLEDETVNELIVNIFTLMKETGLINPIIEFSLTDDNVRAGLIDLTIQLLEADVIPYTEIFVALRESGLAVEVIKFMLTDPETRQGAVQFVIEFLPELLSSDMPELKSILSAQVQTITVCPVPTTVSTMHKEKSITTDPAKPKPFFFAVNATSLI